jgi:hypothetical protein
VYMCTDRVILVQFSVVMYQFTARQIELKFDFLALGFEVLCGNDDGGLGLLALCRREAVDQILLVRAE